MIKSSVFLILIFGLTGSMSASKEVKCVCANKVRQSPNCGICGTLAGSMTQTETGALCNCPNIDLHRQIHTGEASCHDACKDDGGWSGEFES